MMMCVESMSCYGFSYSLSLLSNVAKLASFQVLKETCRWNSEPQKGKFIQKTCYAIYALKWILTELNRRNAVVLLVTGKFTIKLQMESILWSSFTVVSGKWELCFHGPELSNSFTVRKILKLPHSIPAMFVVSPPQTFVTFYTTITEYWMVQDFRIGKDLNPPSNSCFLSFPSSSLSWYF